MEGKVLAIALEGHHIFITGPPGTGKTTILVGLVKSLFREDKMDLSQLQYSSDCIEELFRASPFSRLVPSSDQYHNRVPNFVSPPVQSVFQVPSARCPRLARPRKQETSKSASIIKVPVSNWSRRSSGIVSEEEDDNHSQASSPGKADCSYFFSQKHANTLKTLETFNKSISPENSKLPSPRKNLTPDFLASKKLPVAGSRRGHCISPVKTSLNFGRGNPAANSLEGESEFADFASILSVSEKRVSKLDLFKSLQSESGYISRNESKGTEESLNLKRGESSLSSTGQFELTGQQNISDNCPSLSKENANTESDSKEADNQDKFASKDIDLNDLEEIPPPDSDTMVIHRMKRKNNSSDSSNVKPVEKVVRKTRSARLALAKGKRKGVEASDDIKEDEDKICEKPRPQRGQSRNKPKLKEVQDTASKHDGADAAKDSKMDAPAPDIPQKKSSRRRSACSSQSDNSQEAISDQQNEAPSDNQKAIENKDENTKSNEVPLDPIPDTPKINKVNTNKEVRLKDWFIQPVTHVKGIIVEGERADFAEGGLWHSTCIVHSIDSRSVQTASGSVYKLVGNISVEDTVAQGFTKKFATSFKTGFPHNWRDLVANHFKKPNRAKPKKQNTSYKNISTNDIFETPVSRMIDVTMCKRTSSGRTIIPSKSIEWWKCVRVRINKETSAVEIRKHETSLLESKKNSKKSKMQDLSSPDFIRPGSVPDLDNRRKSGVSHLKKIPGDEKVSKNAKKSEKKNVTQKEKKVQNKKPRSRKTSNKAKSNISPQETPRPAGRQGSKDADKASKLCEVVVTPFPEAEKKWKASVAKSKKDAASKQQSVAKSKKDVAPKQQPSRSDNENKHVATRKPCNQRKKKSPDVICVSSNDDEDDDPNAGTKSRKKRRRSSTGNIGRRSVGDKRSSVGDKQASVGDKRSSVGDKRSSVGDKRSSVGDKRSSIGDKRRSSDTTRRRSSVGGEQKAIWNLNEIEKFKMAVRQIPQTSASFWAEVSSLVGTKNEEECQEFHYKDAPELSAKKKTNTANSAKKQEPGQLDGGNGTLKRKKQMRNMMEKFNEDHDSDFFDSTPFKKQKVIKIADINEVDLNVLGRPDTPFSLQTPGIVAGKKMSVMPFSEKKTPHAHFFSPTVLRSHNKRENDLYIHRMLKGKRPGRKLLHSRRDSIALTPGASGTAGPQPTEKQKSVIFHVTDADDDDLDPDEDQDYYWSDEEIQ